MADTPMIEVERIGGFGGFGLPGARIRSRGQLAWSQLSAAEQAALDQHLKAQHLQAQHLQAPLYPADSPVADGFRYRLTWHRGPQPQTLELPESLVPAALRDCVSDELI